MKRQVCGIALMFLITASLLMFGFGVARTQESAAASSTWNAVVNGDFETGNFDGWVVVQYCGISNTTVHDGSYSANIQAHASDNSLVNSISQKFSPGNLPVDEGLMLDAWIYPTTVGATGWDGNPYSFVQLIFRNVRTGEVACEIVYAWCWAENEFNTTSLMLITLPGWSGGEWQELQRNITADICSFYGQTPLLHNINGLYLDSIVIEWYIGDAGQGQFWVDDVSILSPLVNSSSPTIIDVSNTPSMPNYDQNVSVTAIVNGADQSILSYTTDGVSWNNISMSETGMIFNGTIPARPYSTQVQTVQYEIYAINDTTGNWVKSDTYFYPALNVASTPLSISVTPHYAVMYGGQNQLFRATVTGGSPPYTYQWFRDSHPISGPTTNSALNFTSPKGLDGFDVVVFVSDSLDKQSSDVSSVWEPPLDASVYYSVEPIAAAPLANINTSINGLETLPAQSPVGENFTVEVHLMNATAMNVPAGIAGVEAHFYFGNILNYCKPIGFVDELGQIGGALIGPCIYTVKGFYDDNQNLIANPPHTNATQYMVAAATLTGPWNGNDGLVAKITFQITGQPSQNMSQPDFYAPLQIVFGGVTDWNGNDIGVSGIIGTLRIDAVPFLVGDLNGDGKVGLSDLVLAAQAYGSKPGDPNWNPVADIAPQYGIINLVDVVTLAVHYGQHYP